MTSQMPQSQNHIADLLPAYINGTLDHLSVERVRTHLLHCQACRNELSSWQAIRDAAQFATASVPLAATNVLSQVWEKIEAAPQQAAVHQWELKHVIVHLWLVFRKQILLIHKSIWIASALVILSGCVLVLFALLQLHSYTHDAVAVLALITTVTSATGVAFIYGADNDAGLEVTLSTPTSIRIVMFCRLALIIGYNFVLSAFASIIVALVHGGGFWEIVQLWLGPMLLLSSITLTLSLLIGSWFAVMTAFVLESLQALPIYVERHAFILQLANPSAWQTSPTVLFLAVLFIIFAVFYAPRQPRLSS